MIVPMTKYVFLAHHADYLDFLNELRDLGVLHVQHREAAPSHELANCRQTEKEIRDVLQALRTRVVGSQPSGEIRESDGLSIVRAFHQLSERLEALEAEKKGLEKEMEFLDPWGDFTIEALDRLREAGLLVRFFTCPVKRYRPVWAERYALQVVATRPPDCYFVIVSPAAEEVVIDAEEMPAPAASPDRLRIRREGLQAQIDGINEQLDRYAIAGTPAVETALREAEGTTQLAMVIENTRREAQEKIMLLEGFAPRETAAAIAELCQARGVLYLAGQAKPEEAPPVLLRNAAFSKLFEPIGALFSLPAYQELDLTPFFAPFFLMFFGFCLGDAGYGAVVLLGATLYKFKAAKKLRPVLTLAQFLGLATIIFGVLTGTVFGLNLLDERFAALGRFRGFMLNSDQTFELALILGMVQILFGLFLRAFNRARQYGWAYALSSLGWILLLLSLLDQFAFRLAPGLASVLVWVGVGVILLFSDPGGRLLGRLGKGVWELYGITGFFGDLLSYIRLFALGISSAILGFVVNDIGVQIRDGVPFLGPVLFIGFLLVGHGANLLISALGAFVHPMRLTFVEFYKNAGFAGGGKAYKPFVRQGRSSTGGD